MVELATGTKRTSLLQSGMIYLGKKLCDTFILTKVLKLNFMGTKIFTFEKSGNFFSNLSIDP
jgi:hypothetical protein